MSKLRSRPEVFSHSTKQGPKRPEKPKRVTETVVLRESIDPLLPHPPPKRKYGNRKDLLSRDSLVDLDGIESQADFWDTLGPPRYKQVSFSWNYSDEPAVFLGYRKSIGRVYFDSFTLRCHPFRVGDFVWKTENGEKGLFRIVSAFQATRSFMGFWNKRDEKLKDELQKRGMCFLISAKMRCVSTSNLFGNALMLYSASTCFSGNVYLELAKLFQPEHRLEVFLEDRCVLERKNTVPTSIPTWLFGAEENDKVLLERVKVQVIDPSETGDLQSLPGTLFCRRGKAPCSRRETPLTAGEFDLLTFDARQLVQKHARVRWYHWHRSEHVHMVLYRNEERYKRLDCNERHRDGVGFQEMADSSDDSDGFDENSSDILRRTSVSVTPSVDRRLATKRHTAKLWKELNLLGNPALSSCYHQDEPLPHLVLHNFHVHDNSDFEACDSHEKETLLSKVREYGTFAEARPFIALLESGARKSTRLTEHVDIIQQSAKPSRALEDIRKSLNYPPFRHPQGAVCQHAVTTDDDIYFVAPCGFGKSMCFTIPAVKSGGITLVVTPYKAQIDRQLESLEQHSSIFSVEKLLTECEGTAMKMFPAADRLLSLCWSGDISKPIIMFTTPELVNQSSRALQALKTLSFTGSLRRIVIDEFDVIEESDEDFRQAYLDLCPALRKYCRKRDGCPVQIMALSATVTKLAVLNRLSDEVHLRSALFFGERALPDCQSFRVERKVSNEQVRLIWLVAVWIVWVLFGLVLILGVCS